MSDFKFEELVNKADPFKIQNLFNAILKYCQNNNAVLTEDLVYDFLCSYGLKSIDKENNVSKDINYFFNNKKKIKHITQKEPLCPQMKSWPNIKIKRNKYLEQQNSELVNKNITLQKKFPAIEYKYTELVVKCTADPKHKNKGE